MAVSMKSTTAITARSSVARRVANVCPRANADDKPFSGAQAYSDELKKQAEAAAAAAPQEPAAVPTPTPAAAGLSMSDVMGFSGTAPEITNGRLAMLGFVSAVAAELSSGESVLRQWSDEPTLVNLTFVLFMAGSLVPLFSGQSSDRQLGPFTRAAELLNGRAAMIGFAAMLAYEIVKGRALF